MNLWYMGRIRGRKRKGKTIQLYFHFKNIFNSAQDRVVATDHSKKALALFKNVSPLGNRGFCYPCWCWEISVYDSRSRGQIHSFPQNLWLRRTASNMMGQEALNRT